MQQPAAARGLAAIDRKTATLCCYLPFVGWIAAIFVLASEKFRRDPPARFHAFQGLYLFVAWLLADQVIAPAFDRLTHGDLVGTVVRIVVFLGWIVMLIKIAQDQTFSLPVLGELAERSTAEQH